MTTLYKPVLIESAEQAEAMPPGTVALRSWGDGTTARTLTNGRWITPSGGAMPHVEMVGWTALVPIEAEEEHRVVWAEPDPHTSSPMPQEDAREIVALREPWEPDAHIESRLVTPWKPLAGATDSGDDADALADCGDQA